jgi:hypothetical protein
MNTDPSQNVFVIEVQKDGALRRFGGHAPTRDSDCLQQVWTALAPQAQLDPRKVQRLYSEWELSKEDLTFARRTFPSAELSFSFTRPKDGDWDAAMATASRTIQSASGNHASRPPNSRRWWQFWK